MSRRTTTKETRRVSVELARSTSALAFAASMPGFADRPCGYDEHRGHEWLNAGGRLVCGVCHPPVPGAARL